MYKISQVLIINNQRYLWYELVHILFALFLIAFVQK